MVLRAVILWIHVLCGILWIGICAAFILAAASLGSEPSESHSFTLRIAPQINRLSAAMAIAIPVTGIGNLLFAAAARGSSFPPEFIQIVAAKIGLLVIMTGALIVAWRAARVADENRSIQVATEDGKTRIRQIVAAYGLIVGAGIIALGLGLWLSGIQITSLDSQ